MAQQLLEEQRESWGTRGGFILAAVGSAVGLGNLWGFPYKLYSYGGGAFLIPYILALFVIGVPLLILEFSLGHFTQRAAPDAFRRGNKRFEIVGWWGILLGFVIVTYYPVILAYCFSYLGYSIIGMFNGGELPWAGVGMEGVEKAKTFFFTDYLGYRDGLSLGKMQLNLFWPLVIAWVCMYLCIFKGVKLVGRIVWLTVPLPWLMLLLLTVRGMTLEGSMQGLAYYLDPDWTQLQKPEVWRYAFGQVFFSLSLAFGVMVTYASFLHRKSDINNNAAIIGISDFATSFVAGLAVFATLGAMAFATQQAGHPVQVENVAQTGPSLAFVAFPYALAQLPYSAWFSFVFFFALVTLGIDSAFSITESVLAGIVDKTGWRRGFVLVAMSLVGLGTGLVFITQGGLNWLGVIDGFINGTWGIGFLGLLECVVLGWLWRIDTLRRHANSRSEWRLGKWWDYLIRVVIPLVLGTLFFWQLIDDVYQGRFLRNKEGQWIIDNAVGYSIMILVPIMAWVFSICKGRAESNPQSPNREIVAHKSGLYTFWIAVVPWPVLLAAGWIVHIVACDPGDQLVQYVLWILPICGAVAVLQANRLTNKYNAETTSVSWFARWAGIIGICNISVFSAFFLNRYCRARSVSETESQPVLTHSLTEISYIILAVVLLLIIGGLGWCFYRALAAAGSQTEDDQDVQHADEVGDETSS